MRTNRWMLCLVACLAFATAAQAQGPGGGRRGGGFGGGFGGGGPFGGGGGLFMLVNNEEVQKDLNLSSETTAKLKTVGEEYGVAMRESFSSGGPPPNFREMSEEDRNKAFAKMAEAGKAVSEKYVPKLKEALTADQYTRLQQINWQVMGTGALADPEVVKALAITKDETDKIAQLNREYGEKFREVFSQGPGGGGAEGREKFAELTKERDAKILGVLTKTQQEEFAKLKGKEFDVSALRRGFGGPGGRGPGGRGPGGPGGPGGGRAKRPQPKAE
ncbi:hypothetical protein [Schlesneria sp.]|uniref:hypothetical protein n=1 Tax=Schlesneria sp. TaxID=2762018 RepID=UPI002F053971